MNNLKRVLSLALASVMLIGMMVVGASAADFSDAEDIQHKEAVDVLVALGIVNGKEDGSYFAPEDNVTRGEMAKMIAVAMKGGNDVDTGVKGVPTFTDIGGHWAESYIEYCYDLGIISGRGDGTFDPNANVTGTEVTKMVLSALGYDAEAYKLVGASWATRTDELARTAKPVSLYEDLSGVVLSLPATRDSAAQIIWNGLQDHTVQVDPDQNTNSGEVTWKYTTSGTDIMLKARYGGEIWYGYYTGNDKTNNSASEGEIVVDGTYNDATYKKGTEAYVPSDLDISNIGEKIKVVWKDKTGGSKNKPDKKDVIYGVFNVGDTQVVTATKHDVKTGSDSPSADNKVNIGGTEYTVIDTPTGTGTKFIERNYGAKDTIEVGTGATAQTDLSRANPKFTSTKAAIEALKDSQNGDTIKFILDDNNKIEYAYVIESTISFVTAANSSKVSINNVGSINIADNDIYEGVAKDDIVVVTKLYKSKVDDAYFIVTKADSTEGVLQSYKTAENLKLDNTSYKVLKKAYTGGVTIGEDTTVAGLNTNDIGETFTAYFVNGYVGYLIQNSDTMKDYAVVTARNDGEYDSTFKPAKAELLLADGTKVTAEVHKDSVIKTGANFANGGARFGADPANDKLDNFLEVGQLVKYTVSGSKYKIEEIGTYATGATAVYDKDLKTFRNIVTAGDCVVFVNEAGSYKAYKIRDLKDITTAAVTGLIAATPPTPMRPRTVRSWLLS